MPLACQNPDAFTTDLEQKARKEAAARDNAIKQLERHGVDYVLELTDERRAQVQPLMAAAAKHGDGGKKRCQSGYVGVSKGRKERWQAQVDHRAIGGFGTAHEAGVA
eukprot:5704141-Prymnesium_polylepis.1